MGFYLKTDDFIYLFLLLLSIALGHLFHEIKKKSIKKWFATATGLIIVLIVSGWHIIHPLLTTLIIGVLITVFKNRYCHIISFTFAFLYLTFFRTTKYFGIEYPPPHTNLIQMILTLKLVGLAFEVHDSDLITKSGKQQDEQIPERVKYKVIHVPNLLEVFHYAFCYVGVLTGPYYTYRTYWDLYHNEYTQYKTCLGATINKLKMVPLFLFLYLCTDWAFPLTYFGSDAFYEECSFLYRLFYMYPAFFLFRLRMYIGLTLSECVCTMAGLGLYPTVTEPRPGSGPSTSFIALTEPKKYVTKHVTKGEYSFECIHNIDPGNSEFKPTVRFAMRYWNMTVQYWLATYVYSRLPKKNIIRTLAVFFVSAVWHGVHAGYHLSLLSVPFYLIVEDMYEYRFRYNCETISKQMKWMFILYILKMFQLSWFGVAFQLLYVEDILKYWRSVYIFPYIIQIIMLVYIYFYDVTRKKKENTCGNTQQ